MRRLLGTGTVLLLALTAACTAAEPGSAPPPAGPSPSTTSARPSGGTPTAAAPSSASSSPSAAPRSTSTPKPTPKPDPISMAALAERRYDGRDLRVGRSLGDVGPYERFLVSYRGDGLKISGVMAVPDGKGPFPVLVLNHGYINPRTYFPGQGMPREMDYLARQGYVVLHTDYRNHAGSDRDDDVDHELRLPYTVDTINAVRAVKSSKLRYLDGDRVGWLGRSMGGEVTLRALAAQPGLVDAAVVYASTSSLAADNWKQFYRADGDRAATNRKIDRSYGLPEDSPDFWRAASARSAFDRVTEPVLVHHGTEDDTCPPRWARATVEALEEEGVDVTLRMYEGEGHTFERQWQRSIERTEAFLEEHLD